MVYKLYKNVCNGKKLLSSPICVCDLKLYINKHWSSKYNQQ